MKTNYKSALFLAYIIPIIWTHSHDRANAQTASESAASTKVASSQTDHQTKNFSKAFDRLYAAPCDDDFRYNSKLDQELSKASKLKALLKGVYVGGSIGKIRGSAGFQDPTKASKSMSDYNVYGEIRAGYQLLNNENFVLPVEVYRGIGSYRVQYDGLPLSSGYMRARASYGARVRPGIKINDRFSLHAVAGVAATSSMLHRAYQYHDVKEYDNRQQLAEKAKDLLSKGHHNVKELQKVHQSQESDNGDVKPVTINLEVYGITGYNTSTQQYPIPTSDSLIENNKQEVAKLDGVYNKLDTAIENQNQNLNQALKIKGVDGLLKLKSDTAASLTHAQALKEHGIFKIGHKYADSGSNPVIEKIDVTPTLQQLALISWNPSTVLPQPSKTELQQVTPSNMPSHNIKESTDPTPNIQDNLVAQVVGAVANITPNIFSEHVANLQAVLGKKGTDYKETTTFSHTRGHAGDREADADKSFATSVPNDENIPTTGMYLIENEVRKVDEKIGFPRSNAPEDTTTGAFDDEIKESLGVLKGQISGASDRLARSVPFLSGLQDEITTISTKSNEINAFLQQAKTKLASQAVEIEDRKTWQTEAATLMGDLNKELVSLKKDLTGAGNAIKSKNQDITAYNTAVNDLVTDSVKKFDEIKNLIGGSSNAAQSSEGNSIPYENTLEEEVNTNESKIQVVDKQVGTLSASVNNLVTAETAQLQSLKEIKGPIPVAAGQNVEDKNTVTDLKEDMSENNNLLSDFVQQHRTILQDTDSVLEAADNGELWDTVKDEAAARNEVQKPEDTPWATMLSVSGGVGADYKISDYFSFRTDVLCTIIPGRQAVTDNHVFIGEYYNSNYVTATVGIDFHPFGNK